MNKQTETKEGFGLFKARAMMVDVGSYVRNYKEVSKHRIKELVEVGLRGSVRQWRVCEEWLLKQWNLLPQGEIVITKY